MVGILIVTHGKFASGIMDSVEMIIGKNEAIQTLELFPHHSPDTFIHDVEAAVDALNQGDGVLVFVDLFGATPFNLSAQVASTRENVDVIAGINLAMLIEVLMSRDEADFAGLLQIAEQAGTGGVKILSKSLSDLE